ncbi:MAG: SDR family NAD(P)-dependent oxidoreductase [Acidimicrobiales bacterium]
MAELADPIDVSRLFDVSGRVAVVTGASSGFGQRFARVLAAAGAHVVVGARRLERLEALAKESPRITAVACDVSDDAACQALIARTIDEHGQLDILVNNAGSADAPDKAETEDPARFRGVIDVNLNAVFTLASLAGRQMLEQGGGSIINISSVHGQVGSAPNTMAAYCASKGGINALTRELALQWATRGVRVNAIAPGYFDTELTHGMIESDSGLGWITRNTPMRRTGRPGELDGALLFLASDASSYVTGQVVAVDGGWLAH